MSLIRFIVSDDFLLLLSFPSAVPCSLPLRYRVLDRGGYISSMLFSKLGHVFQYDVYI